MEISEFHINDRVIRTQNPKKGKKGTIVEIPYDGGSEGGDFLGVIWDYNKQVGIQPVHCWTVKLLEE